MTGRSLQAACQHPAGHGVLDTRRWAGEGDRAYFGWSVPAVPLQKVGGPQSFRLAFSESRASLCTLRGGKKPSPANQTPSSQRYRAVIALKHCHLVAAQPPSDTLQPMCLAGHEGGLGTAPRVTAQPGHDKEQSKPTPGHGEPPCPRERLVTANTGEGEALEISVCASSSVCGLPRLQKMVAGRVALVGMITCNCRER